MVAFSSKMGCISGRFGPDEEFLKTKLLPTGFEKHKTDRVVAKVLRHCRISTPVSESQFAEIQKALELVDTKSGPQYREVYGVHFIGQSVYPILVAGILLSKGTNKEKSSSLFAVYDAMAAGSLNDYEVESMLEELFGVATTVLRPLFAELNRKALNYFTEVERHLAKAVQEAKKTIMQDKTSISKSEFISRMCEYKDGMLLDHAGLRTFLKSQTPQTSIS